MNANARVRAFLACFGLIACFVGFGWRLVHIQVFEYEKYAAMAAQKHVRKQVIHAGRGEIRDVNGDLLAANEPLYTLIADGSIIAHETSKVPPGDIADMLAKVLRIDRSQLLPKLDTESKYKVLKRSLTEAETAAVFQSFKDYQALTGSPVRGIYTEPESRRVYPNNEVLCHVLGFVAEENEGIERSMDKWMRGNNGFRYIERDRTGKEIVPYRGQERSARDGYNVRLTINMRIQHIVEAELEELFRQYKPEFATAILMDPKTGRILAMANRPCFNPNDLGRSKPVERKNCAVLNIVEPGSIFKIVPVSAALSDKIVGLDTMINVEGGYWVYGGKPLRDSGRGSSSLSVFDCVVKSSNIGTAKLAMRLGDQRFFEYVRAFGFGELTGINLPGEERGIVHSPKSAGWNVLTITRMPMGQGICVTPLQMTVAMCAIANGGKLMRPQIIDAVVDNAGKTIVNYDPLEIREVVSAKAAAQLRAALKDVVSKRGTAYAATIPGYSCGGKTGTAHIAKPNGGGYYDNRFITSFVGFFPADDPQVVCLVMAYNPKAPENLTYGGLVAAPVFSRIGEQTAHYLNIPPDEKQAASIAQH